MIKKFVIRALIKTANLLSKNERYISSKSLRVIPWLRDSGDKSHLINHNLGEESLVFDLGGFVGDWSKKIFDKYKCTIHIFEPVNKFYTHIKENLISEKIIVNHFGLAERTFKTDIYINDESSSIYKKGTKSENIQLIDFMDYINEKQIAKIDLLKINIEGAEYDLLEYVIQTGYVTNIVNIQVQFHDFFSNSEKRMKNIQSKLNKTHELTYQYPFIWENWQLKK